jgi:radical SAM protein with 4Fe4S-binding SPASM domain
MFQLFKKKSKFYSDTDSFFKKNESFCIMPWVHLHVTQEGFVTPCCQAKWDKELAFGDINQEDMLQIWQGRKFQAFRETMLKGKKDERCLKCYEKEADGWTSLRHITNKKYASEILDVANGNITQFDKPIYLDIRFSNKCNLRCRICGPWSSSNWSNDFALLNGGKYQDENITYGVKDAAKFLDQFVGIIPQLKELYFAGGEPLMIDANYDILQLLIAHNRTDVALFYNSNLTILDYKGRSIVELWNKFEKVTIAASIDDYGPQFEYHRKNANWNTVKQNIALIQKNAPQVHLLFSPTVNIYNINRLDTFHQDMVKDGIVQITDFIPTLLVQPQEYNIQIVPVELKKEIELKINEHIEWIKSNTQINDEQAIYVLSQFKNIITYMKAQDRSHLWSDLLKREAKLDTIRQESFFETFPEYLKYKEYAG